MIVINIEKFRNNAIKLGRYDEKMTVAVVQQQRRERADEDLKKKIAAKAGSNEA